MAAPPSHIFCRSVLACARTAVSHGLCRVRKHNENSSIESEVCVGGHGYMTIFHLPTYVQFQYHTVYIQGSEGVAPNPPLQVTRFHMPQHNIHDIPQHNISLSNTRPIAISHIALHGGGYVAPNPSTTRHTRYHMPQHNITEGLTCVQHQHVRTRRGMQPRGRARHPRRWSR